MGKGGREWRRKVSICEKTEGKRTMSARSRRTSFPYLDLSLPLLFFFLSFHLPGSVHCTSENTCASAAPHFRQETFYRCRSLTAREITLYAANSRKTRMRIVISLSEMYSREVFARKSNTSYESSWLFNIGAYLSRNSSTSRKADPVCCETTCRCCCARFAERMWEFQLFLLQPTKIGDNKEL